MLDLLIWEAAVSANSLPNLFERGHKVVEVSEEIGIDRKLILLIDYFHLDGLTEIHGRGPLDVEDYRVRDGNSDRITQILSFEDDFLDRLDPLVTTGYRIC